MSFVDFNDHTNPLFSRLNIMKFNDIVRFQTVIFMYDFHHGNLPHNFNSFFSLVNKRHSYNTTLASVNSNYSLPIVKTNYGKFNIRFTATKLWNSLDETLRNLKKRPLFKKILFSRFIDSYNSS